MAILAAMLLICPGSKRISCQDFRNCLTDTYDEKITHNAFTFAKSGFVCVVYEKGNKTGKKPYKGCVALPCTACSFPLDRILPRRFTEHKFKDACGVHSDEERLHIYRENFFRYSHAI